MKNDVVTKLRAAAESDIQDLAAFLASPDWTLLRQATSTALPLEVELALAEVRTLLTTPPDRWLTLYAGEVSQALLLLFARRAELALLNATTRPDTG